MDAAREAATALKFNRTVVGMARAVIRGMRGAGITSYNGAHLRLERDAADWARALGGMDKYLASYKKAFSAAGFSKQTDLYVASGLLSYGAGDDMKRTLAFLAPHSKSVQVSARARAADAGCRAWRTAHVRTCAQRLLRRGVDSAEGQRSTRAAAHPPLRAPAQCGDSTPTPPQPHPPSPRRLLLRVRAQYKELYLPPEQLKSLNPEQEALVDFLVLSNSDAFVGLGSSTFSVYLRCAGGFPRCGRKGREGAAGTAHAT